MEQLDGRNFLGNGPDGPVEKVFPQMTANQILGNMKLKDSDWIRNHHHWTPSDPLGCVAFLIETTRMSEKLCGKIEPSSGHRRKNKGRLDSIADLYDIPEIAALLKAQKGARREIDEPPTKRQKLSAKENEKDEQSVLFCELANQVKDIRARQDTDAADWKRQQDNENAMWKKQQDETKTMQNEWQTKKKDKKEHHLFAAMEDMKNTMKEMQKSQTDLTSPEKQQQPSNPCYTFQRHGRCTKVGCAYAHVDGTPPPFTQQESNNRDKPTYNGKLADNRRYQGTDNPNNYRNNSRSSRYSSSSSYKHNDNRRSPERRDRRSPERRHSPERRRNSPRRNSPRRDKSPVKKLPNLENDPATSKRQNWRTCSFWDKGECKKGDNCDFAHSSSTKPVLKNNVHKDRQAQIMMTEQLDRLVDESKQRSAKKEAKILLSAMESKVEAKYKQRLETDVAAAYKAGEQNSRGDGPKEDQHDRPVGNG
jgi:hypothetical protein